MKIGCVYAPRRDWPMWEWVCEAVVNLGHELTRVTHVDMLQDADSECDVLLFEHRDCGIGWRNLRGYQEQRQAVWAQWNWDLIGWTAEPLEKQQYCESFLKSMTYFDICFVKELDRLQEFASLGVNAEYMDQGCWSRWPAISKVDKPEFDVVVFGQATHHYKDRKAAAKWLVECGFKVGWATKAGMLPRGCELLSWCHPNELPALMSRARCTLDIDVRSDIRGYWSDRHWMIVGAGSIPLRLKNESGDIAEHASLIRSMTDEQRYEHGMSLRQRTMESHTYEARVGSILRRLSRTPQWKSKGLPDLQGEDADRGSSPERPGVYGEVPDV